MSYDSKKKKKKDITLSCWISGMFDQSVYSVVCASLKLKGKKKVFNNVTVILLKKYTKRCCFTEGD